MRLRKRNNWERNKKTSLNEKLLLALFIVLSIVLLTNIPDQDLGSAANSLFNTQKEISQGLFYFFNGVMEDVGNGLTGASISIEPAGNLTEAIVDENLDTANLEIQDIANATQCGVVNGSITLTANLTTTDNCFDLNASNVTIDGAGFFVFSNGSGYGFNNSEGFDNVTVKNFGGINNFSIGIYFKGGDNSSIVNNTIIATTIEYSGNGYGIYFLGSNTSTIANNTITAYWNGIFLWKSTSNNVTNNVITSTGGSHSISSLYTNHSNFINNNITVNTAGNGINIQHSNYSNVTGNIISNSGASGISFSTSYFSYAHRNIINTTGSSGIGISLSTARYNNLTNNQITTTGDSSCGIFYGANSWYTQSDHNIINTTGDSSCGISGMYYQTCSNNTITTTGNSAYGLGASYYSELYDNIIKTEGDYSYGIGTGYKAIIKRNQINASNAYAVGLGYNSNKNDYFVYFDTTNTAFGEPIYYLTQTNSSITLENITDIGQLIIANTSNIVINNITFNISGIHIHHSNNITITNCNLSNLRSTGINTYFLSNGSITNNQIINTRGGGIFLRDTNSTNVINNVITGNDASFQIDISIEDSAAIALMDSDLNLFKGNNLSNNSVKSIFITGSNNNFKKNYLLNGDIGYKFGSYDSVGNNLSSELVVNHSSAVFSDSIGELDATIFKECIFINNTLDLNLSITSSSDLNFINCTISKSKLFVLGSGVAYFKWYVDVNVTNNLQQPLPNVTVKSYTSSNTLDDLNTTDAEGMAQLISTEFFRQNEVNYFLTPGTIKATKENYTLNSTSVNLYNVTYSIVNLSLNEVSCGSTIYHDFTFGNNYLCGNNGLIIGADSIVIDGQGYNLTGNISGIGINLNGRSNISISNLKINNYTQGIYLYDNDNSNFTNLIVTNNTYGIVFNESNNNRVFDSIFANNSANDVYASSTGTADNYLINYTENLDNISVAGTAQIFLQWYVDVNASYYDADGNFNNLPGANASGLFDTTGVLEDSKITDADGQTRLVLSELKKASSGTTYLTPHNISIFYTSSSGTEVNSTSINLTQTNNTGVNLSLVLNCISPYTGMSITSDTIFCPGTFYANGIEIEANDITIGCDGTIIQHTGNRLDSLSGFLISNQNNVLIENCTILNHWYGVSVTKSNVSLNHVNITSTRLALSYYYSEDCSANNSYFSSDTDSAVDMTRSRNLLIYNNTFIGTNGLFIADSQNNIITNNTFIELTKGVEFFNPDPIENSGWAIVFANSNNTVYHNNFSNNVYNIYYFNATDWDYNNTFNTTNANGRAQGNEYSDYCDKGTDLDGDGYADSGTYWPYSENITDNIYDPTDGNAGVIDYGPRIIPCAASEVFLGSSSSSSSTGETDSGAAPATPPAAVAAAASVGESAESGSEYSNAEEAADSLRSGTFETVFEEKITRVTVILENTGTKRMQLFPELLQQVDDPFFVVTRKTLGYEDSFFSRLANIAYSKDIIAGRLLKATLLNPEQIILEPGERIEKTLEIEEGLVIPRQMKIQFTTFGETVLEKEVEVSKKAISGTAVDLDSENKLIDLYVVVVPASEELQEYYGKNDSGLTGAAVTDLKADSEEYLLELNINKDGASFSDIYGPYNIKQEQSLVFAQQLKYDPEIYSGEHTITAKIYRGGKVIVDSEFDVNLGTGGEKKELNGLWLLVPLLLFLIFLLLMLFLILKEKKSDYGTTTEKNKIFSKEVKVETKKIIPKPKIKLPRKRFQWPKLKMPVIKMPHLPKIKLSPRLILTLLIILALVLSVLTVLSFGEQLLLLLPFLLFVLIIALLILKIRKRNKTVKDDKTKILFKNLHVAKKVAPKPKVELPKPQFQWPKIKLPAIRKPKLSLPKFNLNKKFVLAFVIVLIINILAFTATYFWDEILPILQWLGMWLVPLAAFVMMLILAFWSLKLGLSKRRRNVMFVLFSLIIVGSSFYNLAGGMMDLSKITGGVSSTISNSNYLIGSIIFLVLLGVIILLVSRRFTGLKLSSRPRPNPQPVKEIKQLNLSRQKYLELINFIKECKYNRLSEKEIKKLLVENGWDEEVVNNSLKK